MQVPLLLWTRRMITAKKVCNNTKMTMKKTTLRPRSTSPGRRRADKRRKCMPPREPLSKRSLPPCIRTTKTMNSARRRMTPVMKPWLSDLGSVRSVRPQATRSHLRTRLCPPMSTLSSSGFMATEVERLRTIWLISKTTVSLTTLPPSVSLITTKLKLRVSSMSTTMMLPLSPSHPTKETWRLVKTDLSPPCSSMTVSV